MVDQNQATENINSKPIMGANPYDLVDNKNSALNENIDNVVQTNSDLQKLDNTVNNEQGTMNNEQVTVNNEQVPVQAPVNNEQVTANNEQVVVNAQQVPVQNQNTVQVQQEVQAIQNNSTQNLSAENKEKKTVEPSGFTKKLIGFIAKLTGQPDPETGKKTSEVKTDVVANSPQIVNQNGQQQVQATLQPENNKNGDIVNKTFDSIMGGVTGFLDGVEKKVEKISGIDLDAPINNGQGMMKSEQLTPQSAVAAAEQAVNNEQVPAQTSVQEIVEPKVEVQQVPVQAPVQEVVEPKVEVQQVPVEAPVQQAVESKVEVEKPVIQTPQQNIGDPNSNIEINNQVPTQNVN